MSSITPYASGFRYAACVLLLEEHAGITRLEESVSRKHTSQKFGDFEKGILAAIEKFKSLTKLSNSSSFPPMPLFDRDGNQLSIGDKIEIYDWGRQTGSIGIVEITLASSEGRISCDPPLVTDAYDFVSKCIPRSKRIPT